MNRISKMLFVTLSVAVLNLGCGDSSEQPFPDIDVGDVGDVGVDVGGADAGGATTFTVRLENRSDRTASPVPLSPGVWALHTSDDALFAAGQPDRGQGLEALAEDGDPAELAASLSEQAAVAESGTFSADGPIAPGDVAEFDVVARPSDGRLSLASMFVESNDVFVAPDGRGLALFDEAGQPLAEREVTEELQFWNAGTERDEAVFQGPNQAPRQESPDTGPSEGVVAPFANTTRALPLAADVARVSVTEKGGTFVVTVANVSDQRGAIFTPISPVFWVLHDDSVSLFETGSPASDELEALAEDGAASPLVSAAKGADGVLDAGLQAITKERQQAEPGPAAPGETFQFEVTPDTNHPRLSLATMVVESNDAFVAFTPAGVALVDASGAPRDPDAIADDIRRRLAIWDAGTEANEVPGVGPNQAPRQPQRNTGPADPNDSVRLYRDPTNDLAGASAGGFADVSITHTSGEQFEVTVTNTSDTTVYPGAVTPTLWAVHNEAIALFEPGQPASEGLERLAEDGDATVLASAIAGSADIADSGVADQPDGSDTAGALAPGDSYTFTVSADAEHRFLSLAAMAVPSNDTFLAFGPQGVALLDASGAPRSDADIAADIEASLAAWDAGTEANQAGAAGPDQAPRQAAPNTGPAEGNGNVRLNDDPVWAYPALGDVLQVTIIPQP